MSGVVEIEPITRPLDATVRVPGSKSLTNRALVAALLAEGTSELHHVLEADDTEAMRRCVEALGAEVSDTGETWVVEGRGRPRPGPVALDARQSGTTARFLAPVLALGEGAYRLDGSPQLRSRPMEGLLAALRSLGVRVQEEGDAGHLPIVVDAAGLPGGRVTVDTTTSSQFASGLLLAAPCASSPTVVSLVGAGADDPFVTLTVDVMERFGAEVERRGSELRVRAGGYRPADVDIEPDATAASYFFGAAAVCGGRVTVAGLGGDTRQGDAGFLDVLEAMGASVVRGSTSTTVQVEGRLRGVSVDLRAMGDVVPTLAAVAVFAEGPTTVTGVEGIRHHESDRLAGAVAELRRCGIRAEERHDGLVVHPGVPQPAVVQTYDDHRMAMAFALLGLGAPGIRIAGAGCVAKTYPGFWADLDALRSR